MTVDIEETRGAGRPEWVRTGLFAAVVLLGTIVSSGCGEKRNSLSGSVGNLYDLSFETVRARLYNSEFAVEYLREDGQVPVRIVVERGGDDGTITTGRIDLEKRGTMTGRVDERDLPPFESGTLRLRSFGVRPGAEIEGTFDSKFRVDDDEFTLSGTFGASQEVVDGSLGYRFRDASDAGELDAGELGEVGERDGADGQRDDQ